MMEPVPNVAVAEHFSNFFIEILPSVAFAILYAAVMLSVQHLEGGLKPEKPKNN